MRFARFLGHIACLVVLATACSGNELTRARASIGVQPAFLDFGVVTPGQVVTKSLTIASQGTYPLRISSLTVAQDGGSSFVTDPAPGPIAPSGSAQISVTLTAPAALGVFNTVLVIASNADNAPQLAVSLTAQVESPCALAPCDANATCDDSSGMAVCTCRMGYSGDGTACDVIDPCQTDNGGCDQHATCTMTGPGTNTCQCASGYTGDGQTCTPLDPCLMNNGGCDVHAICTQTTPGVASCQCQPGYSGDGSTCMPINACLTNNGGCDPNATCMMTGPGTDSCTCKPGYNGNGRSCVPIDPCTTNNGGCDAHAMCIMTSPGVASCTCDPGWSGDGMTCSPAVSCQVNNGGCDVHANCTEPSPGTISCSCNSGYQGTGQQCTPINACLTNNGGCDPNATCMMTGPGTNSCTCNMGYWGDGKTCTAIDFCPADGSGCDAHATCTSTTSSYVCTCDPGWTGNGKTCQALPAVITAGLNHTCALHSGNPYCWGADGSGQLGAGSGILSQQTPLAVMGLATGIAALSAGGNHTCALTSTGAVECWGDNQYGDLGDDTTAARTTPGPVSGLSQGAVAVAAGLSHTCALMVGGTVQCWGSNADGELGDGTTLDRYTPVSVATLPAGISAIAAGNHFSCALTSNGVVECWGDNDHGQLGDGTQTNRTTPVAIAGLASNITAIATGGQHACALTSTGSVACWGDNEHGQLGDGTTINRSTPVAVTGLPPEVMTIAAGLGHTCALLNNGGVECWGLNNAGELGNGTMTDHSATPVGVTGLASAVTAITTGGGHTCATNAAGGLQCWGYNVYGEVGDGSITSRPAPVEVVGF